VVGRIHSGTIGSAPDPYSGSLVHPHRAYDTRRKQFLDFESLVSRLTAADLVFVGEQHDDPATHRMELALLEDRAPPRLGGAGAGDVRA
jgi:uncharacterized iron-regulated protein